MQFDIKYLRNPNPFTLPLPILGYRTAFVIGLGIFLMEEIWKSIPNYEDYQVSSVGNVKSFKWGKEKKFTPSTDKFGYFVVCLSKSGVAKVIAVHRLVAMAFLNHVPNKQIVIDHINNNKKDNRVENLQLITQRHNTSKDKVGAGSSKYTGVSWNGQNKNWRAQICFRNRAILLGCFTDEFEASQAYQKALAEVKNGFDLNVLYPIKVNRKKKLA